MLQFVEIHVVICRNSGKTLRAKRAKNVKGFECYQGGNGPKTSKNSVVFGRGLAEFVESYPKICREVNEKVHLQTKFCNLQKDSEIGNQIAENHNLQKRSGKLQKTVRKFVETVRKIAENSPEICRKLSKILQKLS